MELAPKLELPTFQQSQEQPLDQQGLDLMFDEGDSMVIARSEKQWTFKEFHTFEIQRDQQTLFAFQLSENSICLSTKLSIILLQLYKMIGVSVW